MAVVEVGMPFDGADDVPRAQVHARVGDDVVLRFEDRSGSTGYRWEPAPAGRPLAFVGDERRPGVGPGVSGVHAFTFRADRAGEGRLAFALRRAWEPGPVATAVVAVVVDGTGLAQGE